MYANTGRTIAVIAVWLVTFCILLFGGFTFASWGEEALKNLLGIALLFGASGLTTVILHWRPADTQGKGTGLSEPRA